MRVRRRHQQVKEASGYPSPIQAHALLPLWESNSRSVIAAATIESNVYTLEDMLGFLNHYVESLCTWEARACNLF